MNFLTLYLSENFPTAFFTTPLEEATITIEPAYLLSIVDFLKNHPQTQFSQLVDICGVDYIGRLSRFEVVYHFLSIEHNQRIRLKVPLAEQQAAPSIASLYPCAVWFERETWDMFGIPFEKNPDLRRLLTDYEFEGHPLRKEIGRAHV